MPHKRFVQQAVLEKAQDYLGREDSYEKVVQDDRRCVYDDRVAPAGEHASEREPPVGLAPSTVWRWLSWLGGLDNTRRAVGKLIREKEPQVTLHREPWGISPTKYRSDMRRRTLQQALQLITAGKLFERLFGREIFPDFAIAWSGA